MAITIDSEFAGIIPPQSEDERAGLEASLLAEGCRDALVVWQGHNILVDGHHRYAICTQHGIPFQTVEREFASREDVIVWMVDNQLARRNVNLYNRSELALRKEAAIAEKAKANLITSTGGANPRPLLNLAKAGSEVHTRDEVAAAANTSGETVRKVKTVSTTAPEGVKQQARAGEISVNRAYEITKALQAVPDEYHEPVSKLAGDNLEKVHILARLRKSAGSPETNGTFDEIMTTGGFHYGDEMEKWCNFGQATVEDIRRALDSITSYHRGEAGKNKPHVSYNSGENEWYTPPEYIEAARRVLGTIDLDPASSDHANETVKAAKFYTIETDGLAHQWQGKVWMNPPYAGDWIKQFASKFASHVKQGDITEGIVLVNNATETQWFLELVKTASAIVFLTGRIKYLSPTGEKNAPLQGQAIIYFGERSEAFRSEFDRFGWGATLS